MENKQWKKVFLKDICEINMGKTPSRAKLEEYWNDGQFNWISIRDLKEKIITKTKEKITLKAVKESGIKLIPKNTILMSFKLSIGKLGITGLDMYSNEAIANFPIKDKNKLDINYLYYTLQTLNLMENTDRAVMGATLNKEKLKKILIPLPPLNIQKEIATKLDKLSEIIEKRKEQISKIDELLQSTFWEMFGDPISNPKGWEEVAIKKVAGVFTGNTPPRNEPQNYGKFIEWIKSDNINTPSMYLTEATEFLSEIGKDKGRTVPKNSILITCIAGSLSCIGNAAISKKEVAFNQQINALVAKKDNINYLYLYMLIIMSKKYIQDSSTKGMKGMISKGVFQELKFPIPPLELQNKYASIVEKVEVEKVLLEKGLEELEVLFKCEMQRSFK